MSDIYFDERKAHVREVGNIFTNDEIEKAIKEAEMTDTEQTRPSRWADVKVKEGEPMAYGHPVPREGTQVRDVYDFIARQLGMKVSNGEIEEKFGSSTKWSASLSGWASRNDNPLRKTKYKRRVSYIYDLEGFYAKEGAATREAAKKTQKTKERRRSSPGYDAPATTKRLDTETALIDGIFNGEIVGRAKDGRRVVADSEGHLFAVTVERI